MTSIRYKFRPSAVEAQAGRIYFQIIHQRKPRQIITEYKIFPQEWDEKRGQIIVPTDSSRRAQILTLRKLIRQDIERLSRISRKLDLSDLEYTPDDIIDEFLRYKNDYSLFNYMATLIARLKQNGKMRTSETYKSALNSFRKFRKNKDIMLDSIDAELIENYEAWLKSNGLIFNSIGFYTRILRAVYNHAVDEKVIDNIYPFRNVYTGVDKTVKRALPVSVIKKIIALDLSTSPALDYARDMFVMSFYLRGMSFIDMAFLKKSDLKCGVLFYRRRKTGQQLSISWESEMQAILDKYAENTTSYLLPIITKPNTNERNAYRNKAYCINRNLKKIAAMVDVKIPLTLYVARHSWASVAKAKGIPVSVISEGLGHDSEATTQIYLASLDTSAVDHANSLIIKSVKSK